MEAAAPDRCERAIASAHGGVLTPKPCAGKARTQRMYALNGVLMNATPRRETRIPHAVQGRFDGATRKAAYVIEFRNWNTLGAAASSPDPGVRAIKIRPPAAIRYVLTLVARLLAGPWPLHGQPHRYAPNPPGHLAGQGIEGNSPSGAPRPGE